MNASRTMTPARGALAAALAMACTTAFAAVTFNPDTGSGEVAKDAVQGAFGWNNAALQANAAGVTFSYEAVTNHAAVCTYYANKRFFSRTDYFVTAVGVNVNSTARINHAANQIVAFDLTGFGDTFTQSGTLPVVGTRCSGGPGTHLGLWKSVSAVAQGSEAGLYVNYGVQKVLLNWP